MIYIYSQFIFFLRIIVVFSLLLDVLGFAAKQAVRVETIDSKEHSITMSKDSFL